MFRKAILIIHGFGGGVYDEEYLSTELEFIKNYDVFTFTLQVMMVLLENILDLIGLIVQKSKLKILLIMGIKIFIL